MKSGTELSQFLRMFLSTLDLMHLHYTAVLTSVFSNHNSNECSQKQCPKILLPVTTYFSDHFYLLDWLYIVPVAPLHLPTMIRVSASANKNGKTTMPNTTAPTKN